MERFGFRTDPSRAHVYHGSFAGCRKYDGLGGFAWIGLIFACRRSKSDRVLAGAFAGGFGFRRALLQPVLAAVLAWILFAEPLGALQVFGGVAVLAGIYITRRGAG